jgi:mRNA interferase YafQ
VVLRFRSSYLNVPRVLTNFGIGPLVRAHPLKGEWRGYWECHVAPDWLLIYKMTDEEVLLARTGTHADLFDL